MLRYLRLYLYCIRFSFSRAMEFRMDFFFRVVMDCMFYVVNLAFFDIVFRHTPMLGGWDRDQVIIFTAAFLLSDAIYMTLFSDNHWWLPALINKGDLDYYLVRPASSLFFCNFRAFAANSFMNLVIASGIMWWALARYPDPLGGVRIAQFLTLIILGNAIHGMMALNFIIPTFWMHNNMGMRETYFHLARLSERPHQVFNLWIKRILVSVLPLALINSVPSHILFNGMTTTDAAMFGGALLGLSVFTVLFWKAGLRGYASASS